MTTSSPAEADFTDEPDVGAGPPPAPTTVAYDPSRDREKVRGRLGLLLLILTAVYAFGVTALAARLVKDFDSEFVASLLSGVFTPLVTIFGTIVGFYFGSVDSGRK